MWFAFIILHFDVEKFISFNLCLNEKNEVLLSEWIEVLVKMLHLNDIKDWVSPALSSMVPNLSGIVAMWKQDSDQAIICSGLLVLDSHDEVLLRPGVYWAVVHCKVLLSNALVNMLLLGFQTNLFERLSNNLLEWNLTPVLSSLELELVVKGHILRGGS